MDGLEAVEVSFKKLQEVLDYRIEAEYFQKRFLRIDTAFEKVTYEHANEIFSFTNGRPYLSDEFQNSINYANVDGSIGIAKIGDVTNKRSTEYWEKITKSEFSKQKGTFLKNGDILMSLTGDPPDIGKVSFIFENAKNITWNQRVAKIQLNKKQKIYISNEVLFIVLSNSFCREQVERYAKGIRQRNLGNEGLKIVKIPILAEVFQDKLHALVDKAHTYRKQCESTYSQAQTLLLNELGLHNWQPTQANTEVKSFKNSFLQSGRLDAEYYQPKYDEVEFAIKNNAEYFKPILEIRTYNLRGLQPEYFEDGDLDIINSKHILDKTLDYRSFEKTKKNYWDSNARARVYKNDILTYTTGANIGRTHVYLTDKKALASNHVNILRIKNENPIYVSFVMNSILGRLQTEKLSAGSAQQELYPKDIDNFLIPFIKKESQDIICNNVLESLHLQHESQQLLEVAKQAVELAIEEGEERAMEFIKNKKLA